MPFNTKFTPSQYQDRDQYNENVLNERYATVKALRESYSHIYQELTNLRNNLQDYKAEQDNQPELATSEADRIRYNNEIENRYLALKSIQLNTSYPDEYGHTVRPFSENKAAEQLRLHCNYMISGSHHFKQYHLAKTSCLELNQDTVGEKVKEYNSNAANMKTGNLHVTGFSVTPAARNHNHKAEKSVTSITSTADISVTQITASAAISVTEITQAGPAVFKAAGHNLSDGTKIFISAATETDSGNNLTDLKDKYFFVVNANVGAATFQLESTVGGGAIDMSAGANFNATAAKNIATVQVVNVYTATAHGLADNDNIKFTAATGTGGNNLTDIVNKTFFVRNKTANTFEISATSGGNSLVYLAGSNNWNATATNNTATTSLVNVLTSTAHGLSDNDKIIFTATSGSNNRTDLYNNIFYVRNKTANTFEISATSGGVSEAFNTNFDNATAANNTADVATTFGKVSTAGVFTTGSAHGLSLGDQLFCYIASDSGNGNLTDYLNKSFYVNSIPSTTTFTVSATLGGSTVSPSTVATVATNAQLFSFFKKGDNETVVLTMVAGHGLSVGDSVHLSGFKAAAGYDIFNGLTTATVATTSGVTLSFSHDVFGLHQATAWALATHAGEIDVGYEVFFPYKKFYLNKLDATNQSAVYGKDDSSQTFSYSDNYVESGLDTVEGHIYLLTKGNSGSNAELDGRQTASILGRNVQNLENMIDIVANNANATEQALDRIVQIADLVGVEINHA